MDVKNEKVGVSHNRNIAAAAHTTHPGNDTTNHATWTAAEAVTELTIKCVEATPGALQTSDAYLVVINAPTATIAKTWIEDAGSASQDVAYEMGYFGEELIIRRTSNITRVDVLPISGVDMRFVIGAA